MQVGKAVVLPVARAAPLAMRRAAEARGRVSSRAARPTEAGAARVWEARTWRRTMTPTTCTTSRQRARRADRHRLRADLQIRQRRRLNELCRSECRRCQLRSRSRWVPRRVPRRGPPLERSHRPRHVPVLCVHPWSVPRRCKVPSLSHKRWREVASAARPSLFSRSSDDCERFAPGRCCLGAAYPHSSHASHAARTPHARVHAIAMIVSR